MRWYAVFLLAGALLAMPWGQARAERRVALVIGNAAYSAETPLRNPENDAADVAAALGKLKFEVQRATNTTSAEMKRAVRKFRETIKGADVALLYYSGHGIHVSGKNYLIPVDGRIENEFDLPDQTVELEAVIDAMEKLAIINLVFLDACRNNPFERILQSGMGTRATGLKRGLEMARPSSSAKDSGTLVAFATQPGNFAEDGKGRNSPFTAAILTHIATPDVPVSGVLEKVSATVRELTQNTQQPWVQSNLPRPFYFFGPTTVVVNPPSGSGQPTPGVSREAQELAFWSAIAGSNDPADYEDYLKRYPGGQFASLAERRLKSSRDRPQTALAVPPAPATPASPVQPAVGVFPPVSPPAPAIPVPGTVFRDCPDCPEMVVVPGGSFTMGSPSSEEGRDDDEGPQHRVTISKSFALGRSHVTRGEYAAFVADTGRATPDSCYAYQNSKWESVPGRSWRNSGFEQTDRHPVVCVNWDDAKAYAQWLTRKTGKAYRLPSEAEWEYAARAGTSTARYWGESAHDGCGHANTSDLTRARAHNLKQAPDSIAMCQDGHVHTAPVGSFRANGFGLHDVLGNAWQWTEDCSNASYQGAPSDGSAWTAGDCGRRVRRGGSWFTDPRYVRAALRFRYVTGNRSGINGFRIARTF